MTHPLPDRASQFPRGMLSEVNPRCCCGRDHCVYLDYNNAALSGLDDDLRRAAEAGQVREPLLQSRYSRQNHALI